MVGKPNLPSDPELRAQTQGSSIDEPGYGALDQERAASMSDEGGSAGVMRDDALDATPPNAPTRWNARLTVSLAVCGAALVTLALVMRRVLRPSRLMWHRVAHRASA